MTGAQCVQIGTGAAKPPNRADVRPQQSLSRRHHGVARGLKSLNNPSIPTQLSLHWVVQRIPRSSLICSELLTHVAGALGSFTCDVGDLVRRCREPNRLDSPAVGHHGRRRFGNGGRCNGRPGFLCTIWSPLCTLRSSRSGEPLLVGFFEPRWMVCEVWRHTTLLRERLHLQRRCRYERRHSGDCLPGHDSDRKNPVVTLA